MESRPQQTTLDHAQHRTTARVVGALYLGGMVVGVAGSALFEPILGASAPLAGVATHGTIVAVGAVLWLLAVAGDAAHGVLMFPVLRPHGERVAYGYLGARLLDAAFIGLMALFVFVQIPLGDAYVAAVPPETSSLQVLSSIVARAQVYAYDFGMITVGVAGSMLCYAFYRASLVPKSVAVWGLVGYPILLVGSVAELLGVDLRLLHTIPGGLWELFIGVWLLVRGFSGAPSAGALTAVAPSTAAQGATA